MDGPIEVSEDFRSTDILNLDQVKQEADDAPHIVYDEKEQWAFLFSDAINEMKPDSDGKYETVEENRSEPVTGEPSIYNCHWCSFNSTEPLDLIDHDFEIHSRFLDGKRIHKSYKCPSCDEFTSIDPQAIKIHYETHSVVNEVTEKIVPKTRRSKKKQSWCIQLKRRRDQRKCQKPGNQRNTSVTQNGNVISEDRKFKKILQTRKYRSSLSPETLAKRRMNDALRMRMKRAMESADVKAERRRKQALRARLKRASETPEQVELRRTKQRNRARLRRSLESDEQKEQRKEKERLRARERRAALSSEKKEFIKEMERNRKRYIRQQAKTPGGNHVMNAMEFLTTTLSTSESSYYQSSNIGLDIKAEHLGEDDNKLYPLHLLADPSMMSSNLSYSKQEKTTSVRNNQKSGKTKKKGRPKSKRNKSVDVPPPSVVDISQGTEDIDDISKTNTFETLSVNLHNPYFEGHNTNLNNLTTFENKITPKDTEMIDCVFDANKVSFDDIRYNGIVKRVDLLTPENENNKNDLLIDHLNGNKEEKSIKNSFDEYRYNNGIVKRVELLTPENDSSQHFVVAHFSGIRDEKNVKNSFDDYRCNGIVKRVEFLSADNQNNDYLNNTRIDDRVDDVTKSYDNFNVFKLNEVIPNNGVYEFDLLNSVKQNHYTKVDKINKLLNRMCGKETKNKIKK